MGICLWYKCISLNKSRFHERGVWVFNNIITLEPESLFRICLCKMVFVERYWVKIFFLKDIKLSTKIARAYVSQQTSNLNELKWINIFICKKKIINKRVKSNVLWQGSHFFSRRHTCRCSFLKRGNNVRKADDKEKHVPSITFDKDVSVLVIDCSFLFFVFFLTNTWLLSSKDLLNTLGHTKWIRNTANCY